MEQWNPGSASISPTTSYKERPAYAISCFQVSYWTLVILLKQAFLNRGHFHFPIEPVSRDDGRRSCIDAAFKIWRLLEAYDTCFTLRHAHYGLLYAAYSAVLVILRHAHQDQEHCIRHTKFFWMILSEYQRKFGRGLRKPFKVLKSLMQQMKEVSRRISLDESSNSNDQHPAVDVTDSTYDFETHDVADTTGWPDFWQELMANNTSLMDDTMFGLFTK
ncbi:nitrogen assimilation transcription factor nira [Colletotrichum scovillei]|nr:nitrogen assimilation transcription factor nira [Colletotrichum scovillei]